MKRYVLVAVFFSMLLAAGCVKSSNITSNENTDPNAGSDQNTTSNQTTSPDQNTNKPGKSNMETTESSFFFKSGVTKVNYKGTFTFNEIIKKDVTLHIYEVANLKYGTWYELKLDPIDGVPNERLSLGRYFCVNKDKIYTIPATKENMNKIKTSEEIPKECLLVCQNQELKDTLEKDGPGWHRYIVVNGNTREYHSYDYNDYANRRGYESYTWEKNKGLIYFISGYGAQRDEIELFIK